MRGKYSASAGDAAGLACRRRSRKYRRRTTAHAPRHPHWCLGIVDEQHVAAAADLLHAVREAGKAAQAVLQDLAGRDPSASAQADAQAAFCALCRPRSEPMPPSLAISLRAPPEARTICFALDIDAVGQRVFHRDAHHALAGALEPVGDVAAPAVVDADDRGALRLHAGDQPLLHRGVMLERAVAVDMVLADIEQDADARDRARARDRSGRTTSRSRARGPARRLERQDRGADIAAHLHVVTGAFIRCAISAVVVDLPLVPVMATNGASGACGARSRQNSSMSPITSTPACRASQHRPVRRRMGQRHAGRQHQRGEIRPVDTVAQIGGDEAGLRGLGDACRRCRRRRSPRRRRPSARGSSPAPSRRGRTPRPSCPKETGIMTCPPCRRRVRALHSVTGIITAASAWRGRPAPARPR
jgi:hypothetical protein